MEPDLILVIGLGFLVLAIPAIVAAWSEERPPRAAAIVLVWGGGLILYALTKKPGGYAWSDLPDAIYGVIARAIF